MSTSSYKLQDWLQAQQKQADGPFALPAHLRQTALESLSKGDFPTRKHEEWRYTPMKRILDTDLKSAKSLSGVSQQVALARKVLPQANLLVLLDGILSTDHSDPVEEMSGLTIKSVGADDNSDVFLEMIESAQWSDNNIFKDLAQGLSVSATLIELDKGIEINDDIQILHISTENEGTPVKPSILAISMAANSKLSIVENFVTSEGEVSLTTPLRYARVGHGSKLTHSVIGDTHKTCQFVSNLHAEVAESATFKSHQYLLGSSLSRTNAEIKLAGPNANVVLRGIYLGEDDQHLDIRTYIDHAVPHCVSDQHYRGILNDEARGVFNGLVLVRPDAQHTDAQQSNKNLLLSDKARVDTKPQLEIFADDVKCAHGATVGQLDKDALFYLQSRAISKPDAQLMLTLAFTAEVTDDIESGDLRTWIEDKISQRLNTLAQRDA